MSNNSVSFKRVKRKVKKSQNPLFEKWLKEWKEEAAKNGSEMQHTLNRALKSLKKFPFKLKTGKECIVLENFGLKICEMLDKKLGEHNISLAEGNDLKIETVSKASKHNVNKRKSVEESFLTNKKLNAKDSNGAVKKNSEYVPAYRSGPYAILIGMLQNLQENNTEGFMTKLEIQNSAKDFCDTSFTTPKPGSFYTAWSSINILIRKELVVKEGTPARYRLTEKGIDAAINLKLEIPSGQKFKTKVNLEKKTENASSIINYSSCNQKMEKPTSSTYSIPTSNKISKPTTPIKRSIDYKLSSSSGNGSIPDSSSHPGCCALESENSQDVEEIIFMMPNTFEIILLVDNQERDNKFQHSDQMNVRQLKSWHANYEMRHLKVGDFIWVARNNDGCELVLPYIVERKRMDDLASSIKDGRFHEQKFRLKQSGIENLIYLVEKYGNENQRLGLPMPTLMQAISNTQVINEFIIKVTNNHEHSMKYLYCMTIQLNNIFKDKTLMSCGKSKLSSVNLSDDFVSLMTFRDFNKGSEKTKKPTVRNMLVKHLLQLNGLSVEKAKAIVQLYPTPKALMEALKDPKGERSIAKLTYGSYNRSIGPVIAKQIQMLYTSLILR